VKQPTTPAVPVGVFRQPPPADADGLVGAIYLGSDADTEVAGFPAGYLAWRSSRAEAWVRRHLSALVP
jgi:hypothetical protein